MSQSWKYLLKQRIFFFSKGISQTFIWYKIIVSIWHLAKTYFDSKLLKHHQMEMAQYVIILEFKCIGPSGFLEEKPSTRIFVCLFVFFPRESKMFPAREITLKDWEGEDQTWSGNKSTKKRRSDLGDSIVFHLFSGLNFSAGNFCQKPGKENRKKKKKKKEVSLKILKVQESLALWSLEQKGTQMEKG